MTNCEEALRYYQEKEMEEQGFHETPTNQYIFKVNADGFHFSRRAYTTNELTKIRDYAEKLRRGRLACSQLDQKPAAASLEARKIKFTINRTLSYGEEVYNIYDKDSNRFIVSCHDIEIAQQIAELLALDNKEE